MALPTGKSLPRFLPHPLPTQCPRELTDYPFIGRLILSSINMGRKLHFLVSIIDKKDALIYKAGRKGPSVCPGRRGGVWEGTRPVYLPVCLSAFLSETSFPGASLPLPGPRRWAPATLDNPIPAHEAGGVQGQHFSIEASRLGSAAAFLLSRSSHN